jgi:hypothetical protein
MNSEPSKPARRFLATAMRCDIVRRAICTSALVGTILAAINHGPHIVALSLTGRQLLQIGLTYLVPYFVSTYAATMQELMRAVKGNTA